MNKASLLLAIAAGAACAVAAKSAGDQVLMTINKKPVSLGEFEYLYHKNQSQQLASQPIEEYLEMFVTYKQKVTDAEAEGIDKSEAFQNEFDGYRRDLSAPYLEDRAVEDSLVNAIYERMKTDVDVSHIMVASRGENVDRGAQRQRLDSIRTAILAGSDFEQLARRFSIDPAVSRTGGRMGIIPVMRLPFQFEDAAYATAVGEISPVIETPFGFHIVKVNAKTPARGQVLVEHILKLTQGLSDAEAAAKKAQIDSLYTVVTADSANFADVARRESEDPGSRREGGRLPWFGAGQMVPEFEAISFELPVGGISKPVQTAYGYHIVHKLDARGVDTKDNLTPQIKSALSRDDRSAWPRQRKVAQLRKKYNARIDARTLQAVDDEITANGGLDSTLMARYINDNRTIALIGKQEIPVSEIVAEMYGPLRGSIDDQLARFAEFVNGNLDNAVIEAERNALAETNTDYRNLLNEYRDGMLLFEVSDRKVWSKAKKDREGLENFFKANRDRYSWDKPRFKSFIVFATSDSIAQAAQAFLAENPQAPDNVATALRQKFGSKEIKVEKVIASKGENAITDYLGFGGEKPEATGKWAYYFPYLNKVLEAPEEAADVRGAVTGDYQNYLEQQWIGELKKLYPAKINKKVLKQAK